MDFEKFLKKHQAEAEWNKYYISTKKLGNWAWDYCIERTPKANLDDLFGFLNNVPTFGISEIALACLGKKEVEKRLKELSK